MATATLGNTPTTIFTGDSGETGVTYTGAITGTYDPDIKKQGTDSVGAILRGGGDTVYGTLTTSISITNEHVRCWINNIGTAQIATKANGGLQMMIGDGTNTAQWNLLGSDNYNGGWVNAVIDFSGTPSAGTKPTGNCTVFGWEWNQTTNPANKTNTWMDYFRYGDGYYATGGTSGDEIGFAEINSVDVSNGYGILLENEGVYFGYGELTIGNGTTTTFFEVDGEVLIFSDQEFVGDGLYKIIVTGSGCTATFNQTVLKSGGSTDATRFDLDFSNTDATLTFTNNVVTRADTVQFASGQTATGNTFIDCDQITHAGADMDNCTIQGYEGTANTSALIYNVNADPDGEMDGMTFVKGTAATHAIEFGTNVPSEMTLRNCTFTGYNASDTQNDSTFHFKDTSGTITLNLGGCTGNFSYRSDGATIVIAADPVTVKCIAQTDTGTKIQNARIHIEATGTGSLPDGVTVTIVNSSTTATVTHNSHGRSSNDKVVIRGASHNENNGTHQITVTGTNTYTYTMSSAPGSSPTGTITSTFVVLNGLTDVNGEISMSRVFPANQDIVGQARKSTSPPYYKNAPINGTVSSTDNTTFTAVMIED